MSIKFDKSINMYQWLESIKSSKVKKAMPILSFPSASLLGRTVRELLTSSEYHALAMKAVCERTDSLASVSFMDLSIEAECFGSNVKFFDNEVPTVTGHVVETQADAQNLAIPPVGTKRTSIYIEGIKKAVKQISDRPVFAGVIGPYSLAGRLTDVTQSMILCYEEPELMKIVLDKVSAFLINYILEYKKNGANGVVMAEPLAGMLSPSLADEFSAPYVKQIVDAVQDENFIVIYHNCGNATLSMVDSIVSVGAKAYHFGNAIDMEKMLSLMPSDVVVMGNIDPAGIIKNGSPDLIKQKTLELMNACCNKYPNFVISSGCDIPPSTAWQNIDAFFEAVKEFYS